MHGISETSSVSAMMRKCIQECNTCHNVCLENIMYCLEVGGEHARPDHIRLLMDCAEICQTSANFMLRTSDVHQRICGVCADVCESCAADCDQFPDDAMMEHCAEMCRNCAQSCREMSN